MSDRRFLLWKALKDPEDVEMDERAKKIERDGYYYGYRILIGVLLVGGAMLNLIGIWTDLPAYPFVITVYALGALMENGRFLYSCYHGTQEFSGRKASGMSGFFWGGACTGFYAFLAAVLFAGKAGVVSAAAFVVGTAFYWMLCHMVYALYIKRHAEDASQEVCKKSKRTAILCGILLAAFYLATGTAAIYGGLNREEVRAAHLTDQERRYLKEIQASRKRYEELPSYQLEYSFHTNIPADALAEEAPEVPEEIEHCYYWVTPEYLFTQVLDGGAKEDAAQEYAVREYVVQEYYRDNKEAEEDGQGWYVAAEGRWMPEQEYRKLHLEGGEPLSMQPANGLWEIEPEAIASIEKTWEGECAVYTVTYNNRYKSGHKSQLTAKERYTVNGYGVMIGYQLEEEGHDGEGEGLAASRREFHIVHVDEERARGEIKKMIEKE